MHHVSEQAHGWFYTLHQLHSRTQPLDSVLNMGCSCYIFLIHDIFLQAMYAMRLLASALSSKEHRSREGTLVQSLYNLSRLLATITTSKILWFWDCNPHIPLYFGYIFLYLCTFFLQVLKPEELIFENHFQTLANKSVITTTFTTCQG